MLCYRCFADLLPILHRALTEEILGQVCEGLAGSLAQGLAAPSLVGQQAILGEAKVEQIGASWMLGRRLQVHCPAAAAILSGLPGLGYGRMVQVAISKLFLLLGKVGATDDPYADLLSQSLRGRSENGAAHEYRWLRATPGCTLSFQPVAAFPENVTLAWR